MSDARAVRLAGLVVDFDGRFRLGGIDWTLRPGERWAIVGPNGAGKSALAAVLAGAGTPLSGTVEGLPARVALVSYEAQAELVDAERRKDDADLLDVISEGTPVREMVFGADGAGGADGATDGGVDGCADPALAAELIGKFGLEPLLDRAFRKLSTGETRKLLMVRALASRPDLLVLDEPFDGLDASALPMLRAHLASVADRVPMVLVLNRLDEVPGFVTDVAHVDAGRLVRAVRRDDRDRVRRASPVAAPEGGGRRAAVRRPGRPAAAARSRRAAGAAERRVDPLRGHRDLRGPRLDDPPRGALAAERAERQRQDGACSP